MDEIEDNPWWTDRTRREMQEFGNLASPHTAERIIQRAPALAAETLVAIIRRLPAEQRTEASPTLNACLTFLLYPPEGAPPECAGYLLIARVRTALRTAFGPLSPDEEEEFRDAFLYQHLIRQIFSLTDNRILEERFWFRVKSRLRRFVRSQQRKRYAAAVAGAASGDGRDAPSTLSLSGFYDAVKKLNPELQRTVELWVSGYPISSIDPDEECMMKVLGISREAVSKRLRHAGRLLSTELGEPVLLLRRPRKLKQSSGHPDGSIQEEESTP